MQVLSEQHKARLVYHRAEGEHTLQQPGLEQQREQQLLRQLRQLRQVQGYGQARHGEGKGVIQTGELQQELCETEGEKVQPLLGSQLDELNHLLNHQQQREHCEQQEEQQDQVQLEQQQQQQQQEKQVQQEGQQEEQQELHKGCPLREQQQQQSVCQTKVQEEEEVVLVQCIGARGGTSSRSSRRRRRVTLKPQEHLLVKPGQTLSTCWSTSGKQGDLTVTPAASSRVGADPCGASGSYLGVSMMLVEPRVKGVLIIRNPTPPRQRCRMDSQESSVTEGLRASTSAEMGLLKPSNAEVSANEKVGGLCDFYTKGPLPAPQRLRSTHDLSPILSRATVPDGQVVVVVYLWRSGGEMRFVMRV
jgi:hypothetical protein